MKTSQIEKLYDGWYSKDHHGACEKIQAGWRHMGAYYKAVNISKCYTPSSNSMILDIGGGMGEVSDILFKIFSFPPSKLAEISKDAVASALTKEGVIETIQFDGYKIPLPDRSIDFGFSTHVLEHVPEPRRLLREVHRVCKKVFIEVPIDYNDNIPTDLLLSYGHVNVFTPSTARFLIESEGFRIEKEFSSFTQIRYDIRSYNHFLNMGNVDNALTRSKFKCRYLLSRLKRFIKKSLPSEYCFLITPNDEFQINSLLKTQRKNS